MPLCMEAVMGFILTHVFSPKLTSMCLLSQEHAELDQMLGTGSDQVFPYCAVTLKQDVLEGVPEVPQRQYCPNAESLLGCKFPSSLPAWLSNMPTPQRDVYMSAIWSYPKNITSFNNVTVTSVHCRSLSFVSPGAITHHKPQYGLH